MDRKQRRSELEKLGRRRLVCLLRLVLVLTELTMMAMLAGLVGAVELRLTAWTALTVLTGLVILASSVLQVELGERPDRLVRLGRLDLKWVHLKALLTLKTECTGEDWATGLGWFIPRKYRHVIGDILEDCAEMREAGCTERRIKFHVVYQWVIAVITLVPTAVTTSIADAVRQVISRSK